LISTAKPVNRSNEDIFGKVRVQEDGPSDKEDEPKSSVTLGCRVSPRKLSLNSGFRSPDQSGESSFDSDFVHSGVVFFASTGDHKNDSDPPYRADIEYPSTSPNVVGVGGTWQVPTLIRRRTMQLGDDPQYRNDPNLRFIPGVTRQMWESLAQQFSARVGAASKKILADLAALQISLVKVFREASVNMVAGSDMGGQWCIPGVSLHQEFELLAEAGFSLLEVLQMIRRSTARNSSGARRTWEA
jgi:subtilase family serine protease